MFTRERLANRRTILTSIATGVLIALIAGAMQFSIFHHRRSIQFDTTIFSLQNYLDNYFSQIL